jgi:IclR family transcriptional regulator, acetate operon repressor
MLAFIPEQDHEYFFAGMTFEKFTPQTIKNPTQLRKDLALIRQRGYAIDNEEVYLGSRCIGAPIFDSSRKVAAALSVSGPTTRVTRERVPVFAAAAKNAAAAISKSLGYSMLEGAQAARVGS